MNNIIVQKYKDAWEKHDLNILKELFHDDVFYQEHCNSIRQGIDSLLDYWRENSIKQKTVKFTPIKVIEQNNDIIIYWTASFFQTYKNVNEFLEGIMWITLKDGKIINLIEFFEHK